MGNIANAPYFIFETPNSKSWTTNPGFPDPKTGTSLPIPYRILYSCGDTRMNNLCWAASGKVPSGIGTWVVVAGQLAAFQVPAGSQVWKFTEASVL